MSSISAIPGSTDSTSIGGGEVEAALTPWLGPPNSFAPLNLDVQGKNPAVTHNLPMAYWGKSVAMESLIEFRVTNKNDFYTTELFPWYRTDEMNFQWMVFSYKKTFAEVEPYGGNPRYIESSVEAYSDRTIQRGMAFMIAHEFWKTEMGRDQYNMNLQVIESSTLLTVYHLIIMALLKAKNTYRNWELRFRSPSTTIREALKRMKTRWAILNKGMHAFRRYTAELTEVMNTNDVQPNIWVLPPKSKILMSHAHESEYDHEKAGPLAQNVRKNGQSAYDTIRGINVRETTVFNEVIYGSFHNPLRRIREYGSFFWITNFKQSAHLESYRNEERFAAKIMDASKDGQETLVTGRPLFRLSGRFTASGDLSSVHNEIIREQNLNDLRRRMNDNANNIYVDMFIGYDSSLQNPYHVMQYMGEMWEQDVSESNIRDFAITACNKLGSLTPAQLDAINSADQFMDDLNAVDFHKQSHIDYWRAVEASGIATGENASDGFMLRANGFGTINPPIVRPLGIVVGDKYTVAHITTADNKFLLYTHGVKHTVVKTADRSEPGLDGDEIANAFRSGTHVPKGSRIVNDPLPPLGYGHPAGLKTLADLFRKGDYRGYDKELLAKAHLHTETLYKFHSIWKVLFPSHELGSAGACPSYFRSSSQIENESTAFGLNLYNHARYPVFVRSVKLDGLEIKAEAAAEATLLTGLKTLTDAGNISADDVKKLAKDTDSDAVRAALSDSNTMERLKRNYRNKQYADKTKAYSLEDFLKKVFTETYGGDEAKKAKVLTTVLEILLRDGSSDPVNWANEINEAMDRPIRIASFKSKAPSGPNTGRDMVISRLVISPSSFTNYLDSFGPATNFATEFDKIPVRPMNIFDPKKPLGYYLPDGNKATGSGQEQNILKELVYASGPNRRNTVDSLTNSPVFSGHLASSEARPSGKRNLSEDLTGKSGPIMKRPTLFGSRDSTRESVFGAIPHSTRLYIDSSDPSYGPNSETGTIPVNIALSRTSDIFTMRDAVGGEIQRVYKTKLVSRFHNWALEPNACHRIMAQSWITSRIHLANFENWWDNNCIPLVSFQLWRIRQRYFMGSGILAEGGEKLGRAVIGHHDFQWSDDIIRKVHVGHYTFNFACPVKDPKRAALCEDIVAMGHIPGGETATFCKDVDEFNLLCSDPDNAPGCILVKMTPYNRQLPESPQDVGGRWNSTIAMQCTTEGLQEMSFNPIHGDQVYFYNHLYKLDRLNSNLVQRDTMYHSQAIAVNTVGWLGHHRLYDPAKGSWTTLILDDGPFGHDVYKGCITDRDITGKSIKDMNYESNHDIFS